MSDSEAYEDYDFQRARFLDLDAPPTKARSIETVSCDLKPRECSVRDSTVSLRPMYDSANFGGNVDDYIRFPICSFRDPTDC